MNRAEIGERVPRLVGRGVDDEVLANRGHLFPRSSQTHGFDVVAVRIDQKGGVVARAIVRARAGRAVVAAARLQAGGMKAVDRGAALGAKGDVRAGAGLCLDEMQPQRRGIPRAKAGIARSFDPTTWPSGASAA